MKTFRKMQFAKPQAASTQAQAAPVPQCPVITHLEIAPGRVVPIFCVPRPTVLVSEDTPIDIVGRVVTLYPREYSHAA